MMHTDKARIGFRTLAALGLGAGLFFGAQATASGPTGGTASRPQRSTLPAAERSPINIALDAVGPEGSRERLSMLAKLAGVTTCYSPHTDEERWAEILEQTDLLPYGMDPDGLRYFNASFVWYTNGTQQQAGRAQASQLTYSFPADSRGAGDPVIWGFGSNTGNNVLNARLSTAFGASSSDRGRELIRQAFARWRRSSGITYSEVADDNVNFTQSTGHVATRGDIRIGAISVDGVFGILAFNAFPNASGTGSGGGDMTLDADEFTASSFLDSTNTYRSFRNTVAHEHGHGLGFIHSVPCNDTKLMEPQLSTAFDMLSTDEMRGAQRNYGDRFAGNTSAATAKDFGNLTQPAVHSIIELDLSTNGTAGTLNTDEDWFKFTIDSPQNVVISADPTGGSAVMGQQSGGCTGTTSTVNADQAGNLNIELRSADGTAILQTASAAAAGATETLTANGLAAGTYTMRVFDAGPNAGGNQIVQLYNLTIRVGTSKAPPQAIIGVNKRVAANQNCYFFGNINSRATETGGVIPIYAWDLDGDGTFEIPNTSGPSRVYTSNGVYPVTLRVTDNFGTQDTDSITVTVFGGVTSVTGVTPNNGQQTQTIPVTITGNNFKNVNNASMVTVSGTGVTVTGTPVSNALGTQLTGLSFVIDANAPLGLRNVTVTNSDGSATGNNLFTVNAAPPPACLADFDGNGFSDSNDVSSFLNQWFLDQGAGTFLADFDGSGEVNSNDVSAFLNQWFTDVGSGNC